jgi:3',5'-cyclic AMP phosphodiesterase CpdA
MKLGICSDIHVHRHDQLREVELLIAHVNRQRDLDLLICAGDISHRIAEIRAFFGSITLDCPRAWVPGNHDLWVIDAESETDCADTRYRSTLPAVSGAAGWHYLPAGPLELPGGGFAVVGTTGWFTGPGYSEWHDAEADQRDEALALRFGIELENDIATARDGARLIVVTHHVPHPACLPEQHPRRGEHSARLAEVIARHSARIALVVHGHKHRRHGPSTIDGVRYVAHPFGYPGQHERPEDGLRVLVLTE